VTLKGKSFRKSVKAITSGCFVVIQGKLGPGGNILALPGPCCMDLPSGVRNRLGVGGCALT